MTNLDGLSSLSSVGGYLQITSNASLTNLDGLSSLSSVGGNVNITNDAALTNLDGLSSLSSVGGYLNLWNNISLTNLDGLSSLTSVGQNVLINNNDLLTNLDGLSTLNSVGGSLYIINSNNLSDCCGIWALLDGGVPGIIYGNQTGCDSYNAIEEACNNPDSDGDGISDADDDCPDTPEGEGVNADGCSCSQVEVDDNDPCTLDECSNGVVTHTFQDADGDGVCDANDQCPDDANKTVPGACGCGEVDVPTIWYADTDGDGAGDPNDSQSGYTCIQPAGYVANSDDQCPDDANKSVPGACGCGVADVETTWYADTDGDGAGDPDDSQAGYTCDQPEGYVANSDDQCPDDGNKTEPGACGCGVADTDSDNDGVADCIDNCIETANPDQEDGDGDGIGDVCDACPTIGDPNCATCGNGKYLVCHVPSGDPENLQQLCLPLNGANAHIGNHGGCFWGLCAPAMSTIGGSNAPEAIVAQHLSGTNIVEDEDNPLIETAGGSTFYFEVAPNPASDMVTVHLHGHEAGAHLAIYDQSGRIVWNQAADPEQSIFTVNVQEDRFHNGMYFMTLTSRGERITKRLVIAK
ncbi:MAG: T9SS type A sorting domain-containing protein [Saprospiraceae bacterium]